MPRTPAFVATADCHLQERAWERYPDLAGDAIYGFEQVVDLAAKHQVSLVAAGDILDVRRPSPRVVEALRYGLDHLYRHGCIFIAVKGQHDLTTPHWAEVVAPSSSSDTVHFLTYSSKYKLRKGLILRGFDYQTPDELAQILAHPSANPTADVFVTHQMWAELNNGRGDASLSSIRDARMLVTGDLHRSILTSYKREIGGDLIVLSPGSLAMQSIDEDGSKYCALVYDDLSVEWLSLRSRSVFRAVVLSEGDLAELVQIVPRLVEEAAADETLPVRLRKPICDLRLDPAVRDARAVIERTLAGKAHLVFRSTEQRRGGTSMDACTSRTDVQPLPASTLAGALAEEFPDAASVPRRVGTSLLSAADPANALDKMAAEVLSQ